MSLYSTQKILDIYSIIPEDIQKNTAIARKNEFAFVEMVSEISKVKLKKQVLETSKVKEKL
ncbi:hypothetical protein [Clostridium thermosuccinogenes]|jgi:hypothetical protein|nr:hypothetical protein [Pseudoclostridium thermosuccinogenes]PNT93319.1 hypothetical protein CDQ83_07335 [Pseudoclostridium thermosuccinogenes]